MDEAASHKINEEMSNQEFIINTEINYINRKCGDLAKTCKILDDGFVSSVQEAETKNVFKLIVKANALK